MISHALAKKPRDRYRTAGRLGTAALAAAQDSRRLLRPPRYLRREPVGVSAAELDAALDTGEGPTRIAPPTRATVVRGHESTQAATAVTVAKSVAFARGFWNAGGRAKRRRRHRAIAWTAGVVAALAIGAGVIVAALTISHHPRKPPGPLTTAEITSAVQQFATDYAGRDGAALGRLLAPNVMRIDTSGTQRGYAAVRAQYDEQLDTKPFPTGYTLAGLTVTPGWAGRVSGTYTVTVAGGSSISGHVVFGLERRDGRVEIALIVTREG